MCTCLQVHHFLLSGREDSAFYIRALYKIDVLKEQANFSFTTMLRFHFCGYPQFISVLLCSVCYSGLGQNNLQCSKKINLELPSAQFKILFYFIGFGRSHLETLLKDCPELGLLDH